MYLGRAYYRKGRFQDAHGILQRALALNQEDEFAWLAFGLTQLRVGQVDKGLESLKGGITLASRVMVDGYHNYIYWDTRGLIRASIRRSAFLLTKGAEEKDNIIQATDRCWRRWTRKKISRKTPTSKISSSITAANTGA